MREGRRDREREGELELNKEKNEVLRDHLASSSLVKIYTGFEKQTAEPNLSPRQPPTSPKAQRTNPCWPSLLSSPLVNAHHLPNPPLPQRCPASFPSPPNPNPPLSPPSQTTNPASEPNLHRRTSLEPTSLKRTRRKEELRRRREKLRW